MNSAHTASPGMSPRAFSNCTNTSGLNSYDFLTSELGVPELENTRPLSILDLACGDGHLIHSIRKILKNEFNIIGIDMAESELSVARTIHRGGNIEFRNEKAQKLSLASNSIDAVLCHMAFMLMLPVEPVISEIHRILKVGGIFCAVVTDKKNSAAAFKLAQKITAEYLHRQFPNMSKPLTGDPRTESEDGIRTLLKNFRNIRFSPDQFGRKTNPEGVWDMIKEMYLVTLLPKPSQSELRSLIISNFKENFGSEEIHFQFPMMRFTALR
jgi:ubiquinone/menaquinone biosynthesis C-methylase UbiE